MRRLPALVAMMVAVPLVAFGVAHSLLAKHERDWQAMLGRHNKHVSAEQRAATSLQVVCDNPNARRALESLCSRQGNLRLMRTESVVVAGAGLAWLGLIAAAGWHARGNRLILLRVFRPGLYLTSGFLIILVVLHAALAVATLYFGESALLGRVHLGLVLVIAVGALLGVLAIARAALSAVRSVTTAVIGQAIPSQESPDLWAVVRSTASVVGVAPPDHVVVGLDPNFFVTEAPVRTPDQELRGRTMFLSLHLARILTRDELRAIIGHELGHYKGEDTDFSRRFYPIYRGTYEGLRGLEASGGHGASWIPLLPATAVLSFFLESFAVAENTISRERELEADRVGARMVGARAAASALVKVHAFAGYWQEIRSGMGQVLSEGKAFTNVSGIFSQVVAANAGPEALRGLGEQRLSHPTDSHPPLAVRLESLGLPLGDVEDAALDTNPVDSAVSLVTDFEKIEEHLSEVEHYVLAQSLGLSGASAASRGTTAGA